MCNQRGRPALSPWSKAQGNCQKTSDNQPLFTSLDILWRFHTRAILHSLANARKCQLKDFCEKERYESCSVQRMFTVDALGKVRKGEKLACRDATTRFPRASYFKKPTRSVPETWGRMYDVLALRN